MNWLDPEPDTGSSDYGKYIEELEQINSEVNVFRGFHQPPAVEYRQARVYPSESTSRATKIDFAAFTWSPFSHNLCRTLP